MADTDAPETKGHRWFAAVYDTMSRPMERGPAGRWRREMLAGVHGDVLEIGAGTGTNFKHYPADARVTALEPDPYMLKRAQRRLMSMGATNIDVQQAPAERLPFDDASFDAVVSTLVLCTVRDVGASISEVRRVLRPGGRFFFIEHVRGERTLGRIHDTIVPVWRWCAAGCEPNRRTEDAITGGGFAIEQVEHKKAAPWMPVIVGTAVPT